MFTSCPANAATVVVWLVLVFGVSLSSLFRTDNTFHLFTVGIVDDSYPVSLLLLLLLLFIFEGVSQEGHDEGSREAEGMCGEAMYDDGIIGTAFKCPAHN